MRGRASSYLLEGSVAVAAGQTLDVSDAKLQRVQYARLARKGGSELDVVHGPLAGYTFRTALENSTGLCHGAFAGYSFVFSSLTLSPRVQGCRSEFSNSHLSAVVDTFDLGLRVAKAWDLPVVSVELGLGAGGALHRQRFETEGSAPPRDTFAPFFGADVGLIWALGAGFDLFGESGVESHVFQLERADRTEHTTASVAFRQRLGVAKLW